MTIIDEIAAERREQTGHLNRARWSREQRQQARAAFATSLPTVEQERATKLSDLRRLAEAMRGIPHMAATLATVEAEVERLYLAAERERE